MTTEYAHILPRRGTAAAWTAAATVLHMGEEGLETDTGKTKRGDGVTAWLGLPYDTNPAAVASAIATQHTTDNFIFGHINEAPLNARRYGAVNDGTTDDAAAYQDSIDALPTSPSGVIGGTILIDGPTHWNTGVKVTTRAGVKFQGAGGFTNYITPGAGLTGALLQYAIPNSIYVGPQLENIGIDMLDVAADAIEIQGGYNQVSLRNVFVMGINKAHSGFRLIPAPGAVTPVSQTLLADNCYAQRTTGATGCTAPLWLLEHVNEGVLTGCKGIGASITDGGTAFQIKDSNNLRLLVPSASNCSIGFDVTTTVTTGAAGSAGVVIDSPYYETIGKPFQVAGNATHDVAKFSHLGPNFSGSPLVTSTLEYALLPKLEMASLPLTLNAYARLSRIFSDDDTQINDASGESSNLIMGYPNAGVGYTQFNHRVRFPSAYAPTASGDAALLVEVNDGAVTSVRQIKVGAADSGGTGYRYLRVTN